MSLPDVIGLTGLFVVLLSSILSIGVWIGLRRAESKRIVKVEETIRRFQSQKDAFEKEMDERLDKYLLYANQTFARKDNIEVHLEYIKKTQQDILRDIEILKESLHSRRKEDVK